MSTKKENDLNPIDPNYKASKTLMELWAEHPDWAGLRQLALAERDGGLWNAYKPVVLH